jgi:putative Mg2+ transporter-C (MgtC) family protein
MEISHDLLVKLAVAILVGGVIGLEREMRSKSAGFRTIILICLGAMLFTVFSKILGGEGNPDRIASNVVTGIGFLGAGVIFRSNTRVNGITTAASIWISAALGVGIGCGYYSLAILGCILVVSILVLFSFFDRILDKQNQLREYKITFPYEDRQQHKYEDLIRKFGLKIYSRSQSKIGNIITGSWSVGGNEKNHHAFIEHILEDKSVSEFTF